MKGLRKIIIILKNKIKGFSEEEDVSDDIEENAVSKIFDSLYLDRKDYELDYKVNNFINWYLKNMCDNRNEEYSSKELKNFIEKMAVWYELRYPDYEINRLLPCTNQELTNINQEMFVNNQYIRDILDENNEIKYLDWNDFYNEEVFVKSLSSSERKFLNKPKYKDTVWIDRYFKIAYLHLEEDGIVEVAEGMLSLPGNGKFDDSYFHGKHIKEVVSLLKENNIYLPINNELEEAILRYENHVYFYQELLNCVMYRIIERGKKRFCSRRAYLFAKEFGCNKDIPIKYGVDLDDPGLREFINLYLKDGGNVDLECFTNYKTRLNKWERVDTITISELLTDYSYKGFRIYTQEEDELHQRLVNVLVNRSKVVEEQIKNKKLIRKLEKVK